MSLIVFLTVSWCVVWVGGYRWGRADRRAIEARDDAVTRQALRRCGRLGETDYDYDNDNDDGECRWSDP